MLQRIYITHIRTANEIISLHSLCIQTYYVSGEYVHLFILYCRLMPHIQIELLHQGAAHGMKVGILCGEACHAT